MIDHCVQRLGAERFLLLDFFPENLTADLVSGLKQKYPHTEWIIAGLPLPEAVRFAGSETLALVVDCYQSHDAHALTQQLKNLLSLLPQAKLIAVGAGDLRKVQIGSFYGKGSYLEYPRGEFATGDSGLLEHSKKLIPKYGLGDIVLGPLTKLKLEESIAYVQTKSFCENEWGFKAKHSRGHSVTLLFHGESGTGKTMAAEVIAKTLGLPLYQIDLSSVVSKWVGETEKNLKQIFRSAEGVRGILLFDEGDAIFGSRTETKSSQDRYSNLEVNYLLQEIEAFEGIAILSTNYFRNMDEAFLRRFTYCIPFSAPSPEQRESIWRLACPKELPLGQSVDFSHLARFSLSGGNIKNSVRYAAALAAIRKRTAVEQEDFLWAIKRELQKHDKTLERDLVGETFWRRVATEWEPQLLKEWNFTP